MRKKTKKPSLPSLIKRIAEQHLAVLAGYRNGIQHAKRCGELLNEAKKQIPHKKWLGWLKANTKISVRTSNQYKQLATHWGLAETLLKKHPAENYSICEVIKLSGISRAQANPEKDTAQFSKKVANVGDNVPATPENLFIEDFVGATTVVLALLAEITKPPKGEMLQQIKKLQAAVEKVVSL